MMYKPRLTLENKPLDAKLERPIVLKPPQAGVVKISLNKTGSRPASAASLSVPFQEARQEQRHGDLTSRGWQGSPTGQGAWGRLRKDGRRGMPEQGTAGDVVRTRVKPDSTPSFSDVCLAG